jgi:hypothetical protein
MKELHKENKKTARVLRGMGMGFNGVILGVKLHKVKAAALFKSIMR